MGKKYFREINIARGLGVLFVLLGHSFPRSAINDFNGNSVYELIFNTCYSFHMALFFFLAGFVAAQKLLHQDISLLTELKKKAKRLLVPYLFYSFITVVLKQIFSAYAYHSFDYSQVVGVLIGKNANGGLWFLWGLFMVSMLAALIAKIKRYKLVVLSAVSILLFALSVLLPPSVKEGYVLSSLISYVFKFMIFYVLGILTHHVYPKVKRVIGKSYWLSLGSAVLLIGLNYLWDMRSGPLYFVTAFLGIVGVLNLSILLLHTGLQKAAALFDTLGTYSYDIYLLSYYVQVSIRVVGYTMLHLPYAVVVLAMFVLGGVVPLLTSKYIIRKNKILTALLIGA